VAMCDEHSCVVVQSWKKPFNPLLGETWQAEQANGGCRIFMEQISHHPPISAFEMIGPGGMETETHVHDSGARLPHLHGADQPPPAPISVCSICAAGDPVPVAL